MADSFVNIVGDGVTTVFSIPFDYLDNAHVTALVGGVATPITFPTVGQAEFAVAPADGTTGRISRSTPRDTREVVWQNAANLSAGDLNTSDLQLLFIAQEAFDAVANTSQDAIDSAASAAASEASNLAAALAEIGAETAESNAQTVLTQMQILYDDWDDRYLGSKASDPTLDNDGDPLINGALYFNTTSNNLRVYDLGSTTWLVLDTVIADDSITNTKLSNMSQATIKGRADASGTGDPVDLTASQVKTIIGGATTASEGLVELLTNAEFEAGSDSTRGMTASNFTKDVSSDGYITLPGGLLLQWGKYTGNSSTPTVTFPTAFGSAPFSVTTNNTTKRNTSSVYVAIAAPTATTFYVESNFDDGTPSASGQRDFFWMAIGAV